MDGTVKLTLTIDEQIEAVRHLLDIAVLAEFYAPGELGEFPDMTRRYIAEGRRLIQTLEAHREAQRLVNR